MATVGTAILSVSEEIALSGGGVVAVGESGVFGPGEAEIVEG